METDGFSDILNGMRARPIILKRNRLPSPLSPTFLIGMLAFALVLGLSSVISVYLIPHDDHDTMELVHLLVAASWGILAVCLFWNVAQLRRQIRLQQEIQTQLGRAQYLLDNAGTAIYGADMNGRLFYANNAASAMLGYSREEFEAMYVWDISVPIRREAWAAYVETLRMVRSRRFESTHATRDGRVVPVEVLQHLVEFEGETFGFGFVTDISRRKEAEKKLLMSRFAEENASIGMLGMQLDGTIFYANPWMCDLLGYTREELQSLNLMDIEGKLSPQEFYDLWGKAGREGRIVVETVHIRKDGTRLNVEVVAHRFKYEGQEFGYAYVTDISGRIQAEHALRENKERLELVIDGAGLGTWDWNLETDRVVYGANWASMLGYDLRNLAQTPETFRNLLHPEDGDVIWGAVDRNLNGSASSFDVTIRLRASDGAWRWILTRGKVTARDRKGKPVRLSGTHLDVTEQKRAQEALAQAQAIAKLGNWDWHVADNSLVWSDEMYRIFGLDPEHDAPSYAAFMDYVHPEDRQRVVAAMDRALTSGNRFTVEHRVILPDGGEKTVRQEGRSVQTEHGKPVRMIGTVQDVTEQRHAQAALRESEQTQRRILEAIGAGIFVVETETGTLLDMNERAAQLVDRKQAAVIGRPVGEVVEWHFPNDEPCALDSECALRTWEDMRLCLPDDSCIPVRMTVIPALTGTRNRRLVIVFDIREQKKMENQLQQARKMESIGQLSAGLAHEINTPLQFVGDNVRFLGDSVESLLPLAQQAFELVRAAPAERERIIEKIGDQAEEMDLEFVVTELPSALEDAQSGLDRVTDIVRSMKVFAHSDQKDEMQPVDVNEAVANTVMVARNEWKYVADVRTEYGDGMDNVPCFPSDLNQIILNLLVNAAHAVGDVVGESGEKGEILITTARIDDWAEIRVADTGTGIPDAARNRIFDPFFTTKPVGKGTGQGLAIVYSMVTDKLGGEIRVQNRPDGGAVFTVRIPCPEQNI